MPDIYLRPWRIEDVRDVGIMVTDEHLRRWSAMPLDVDAWVRREVAQPHGPTRAVCWPGADRVLGRVAVRPPEFASAAVRCDAIRDDDQPAGELSYWLVPHARGQGIAEAAVRSMIATVVPQLGLRSVVLDIEPGNTASVRLAQRLRAERRSPSCVERDRTGTWRELVVFVLDAEQTAAHLDQRRDGPAARL